MAITERLIDTGEACWHVHGEDTAFSGESAEEALSLVESAAAAAERAHAPYSQFPVGASVSASDGTGSRIFRGCNVENASYGATMCAERVAIFSAVSAGFPVIDRLALSVRKAPPGADLNFRSPCGLCRQVLSEFSHPGTLILIDGGTEKNGKIRVDVTTIDTLLPWRFLLDPPG